MRENIECLTQLLRKDEGPFWRRLREVVRERGVDPDSSILAVSFEDDVDFEYGVIVTGDRRIIRYGFRYAGSDYMDGVLTEWQDVTHSGIVSHLQRSAADVALSFLDDEA